MKRLIALVAAMLVGVVIGSLAAPGSAMAQAAVRLFATLEGTENNPTIEPILVNSDGELIVRCGP